MVFGSDLSVFSDIRDAQSVIERGLVDSIIADIFSLAEFEISLWDG